jgi:hypothetical protein
MVFLMTTMGWALFLFDLQPRVVPVERLIANTTAYIKENPSDPKGPYTLARIHYLAFATRSAELNQYPAGRGLGRIDPAEKPKKAGSTEAQLRAHLNEAIENYRKAIQMDARNELFHLGLASVSAAALDAGFKLGPIPGSTETAPPKNGDYKPLWREQAIAEYLQAYQLSIKDDLENAAELGEVRSLVSYEAGHQYVDLVKARGIKDSERKTLAGIRESLETFGKTKEKRSRIPRNLITPIIFSLNAAAPLEELLDSGRTVSFDLDGTRRPQRYTWVRPDTGILVWDPHNSGKITSGHQLFGSVTFQMFWTDGYRALDTLDDNRDGKLRGSELAGLSVWFDRNQNGISERGEVIPIEGTVAAISARATSAVGISLANEAGIELNDGRILPTYDWTTAPLQDNPPVS